MSSRRTEAQETRKISIAALCCEVVAGKDRGASVVAEGESLSVGTAADNDLRLTDSTVSRYHLELSRSDNGILISDLGSTNGTAAGQISIQRAVVPPGITVRVGKSELRISDGGQVEVELLEADTLCGIRGQAATTRRLMARIQTIASSDSSVLLVGESGTGKELIAHAVHELSARCDGPFETVDCGTLTPALVASDLFGHEQGAFTGAERQHVGAFERANGGTLFLDEVGELPEQLQIALLGVLERRQFRRVGGSHRVDTDVRIVSATNRDLRTAVNAGRFRADLYYRLAVVPIKVPPLRERADDIRPLTEHFLRTMGHTGTIGDVFSEQAVSTLEGYHWPGNIRELRNIVEATLVIGEGAAMSSGNIDTDRARDSEGHGESDDLRTEFTGYIGAEYKSARARLLRGFEKAYLDELLERANGNVSQAARMAGLDRSYLSGMIQRHKKR